MSQLSKTVHAILNILSEQKDITGSRELSRMLKLHGVLLTERTVRYHLKILDEKGFTQVFGKDIQTLAAPSHVLSN